VLHLIKQGKIPDMAVVDISVRYIWCSNCVTFDTSLLLPSDLGRLVTLSYVVSICIILPLWCTYLVWKSE
jgi:hypothetical protein